MTIALMMIILMQVADFHNKYYLPRVNMENDNIEIDDRNFYDQPINVPNKKYYEVRKTAT